jgi:hypothetical protein
VQIADVVGDGHQSPFHVLVLQKRRRSSCHSSCCSSSWLPTSRVIAASLGKMPTTLVRRLMGSFAERTSQSEIDPLQRVGAPDLAPVHLRELEERQHIITGGLHDRHGGGELFAQHRGDPLPVGPHLIGRLDHEHRFHRRRHHVLGSLGHVAQQVAQEAHPAPLPGSGAAQWLFGMVCLVEVVLKPGKRACPPVQRQPLSQPLEVRGSPRLRRDWSAVGIIPPQGTPASSIWQEPGSATQGCSHHTCPQAVA